MGYLENVVMKLSSDPVWGRDGGCLERNQQGECYKPIWNIAKNKVMHGSFEPGLGGEREALFTPMPLQCLLHGLRHKQFHINGFLTDNTTFLVFFYSLLCLSRVKSEFI